MSSREPFVAATATSVFVRGLAVALWFVIGCFVIAMVALIATVALVRLGTQGHGHSVTQTRTDAVELRSAVLLYMGQEAGAACPTMADIRSTGVLDRGRRTEDAWGVSFVVVCSGDDIDVISSGPDRAFGTADDIRR